jgi:amidase
LLTDHKPRKKAMTPQYRYGRDKVCVANWFGAVWKLFVLFLVMSIGSGKASAAEYQVAEKDIATLQADMAAGRVTSAGLVQAYIARIDALDRNGPQLHAVIAVNPNAIAAATALDAERKAQGARGPLHGIPILVKDNIETADPLPTTAGSLALADNITHRDAPLVAKLRAAGAVILGKTNLSEWANFRSSHSISGWSGVGGLAKNPYVLDRSPCGSSAGSAVGVAASLAAAAIGTETNGSLVCPGSFNGIVSFKPTLGLVSRTHVVPISHNQDTAGPMARTVTDAGILLNAMSGSDAADAATANADAKKSDFSALSGASLQGKRLGVLLPPPDTLPSDADLLLVKTLAALKAQGAEIVEISDFVMPPQASFSSANQRLVLQYDFKADLNAYLASLPASPIHTLSDLIAFNAASPRENALFGQNIFIESNARGDLSDPVYIRAHDELKRQATATLDDLFGRYRLDALIRPTTEPAFRIDTVRANSAGGGEFTGLAAVAGYPHLTVPMGYVNGLPIGLSIIGSAWSDARMLALGYAFEQASHARKAPNYLPSLEATEGAGRAFSPVH